MKNYRFEISPLVGTIVAGLIGALIGAIAADSSVPPKFGANVIVLPEPYRIPKAPGGTVLRLAMVHDILHERYLRHGAGWYRQRNSDAEKVIAASANIKPPSEAYLSAMDDLAVGLEQLGQMNRALSIARLKIQLISPVPAPPKPPATLPDDYNAEKEDINRILATHLSPLQQQQYTACANLGTILLLSSLQQAMAGEVTAKNNVRESLDWIERAIAINPYGHFGREIWQAIAIEDLLAALQRPELLNQYDLFGDPLDKNWRDDTEHTYWYNRSSLPDDATISTDERWRIRLQTVQTFAHPDWKKIVHPDYQGDMPFDEPTLAIIGMWTMGGGPNPHFALTLGRIMEHVGQYSIAWEAYERAKELSDTFWPDAAVRRHFVDYCQSAQAVIAATQAPGHTTEWQQKMLETHRDELFWGIAYQNAYHDFESKQIAAGVQLNDPDFYKSFFIGRPNIASAPGLADDLIVRDIRSTTQITACAVLGMGIAMALSVIWPGKKIKRAPAS